MLQKIKLLWSKIRFRNKVLLIFFVTLSAVLLGVSLWLIHSLNNIRYEEEQQNLRLLDEQLCINFSEQLKDKEAQLYTAMIMYNVPSTVLLQSGESIYDLHFALSSMLYSTSPFDFVMTYSTGGHYVSAGSQTRSTAAITAEAQDILQHSPECGYGVCEWYCGDNGDLYLMRDIYGTTPLVYCGRIIAHLKSNYDFAFGEQSKALDYSFLFYAAEGDLLYSIGAQTAISYKTLDELESAIAGDVLSRGSESYFVEQYTRGGITAVGLTSIGRIQQSNARVTAQILVFGAFGTLAGMLFLTVCLHVMTRQLEAVCNAMDRMSTGTFNIQVPVISQDDIGRIATHFNDMAGQIEGLMQRVIKEQALKTQAQFKLLEYHYRSLQTQLSPHFIFNALETINAMAKIEKNTEVSKNIQLLSHYFRLVTHTMSREFTTIENEISGLQDYAAIHRNVHGSHLTVTFSCEDELRNAVIPVMIVQPILENALVHGLNSADINSTVTIVISKTGVRQMQIAVSDNGIGIDEAQRVRLLNNTDTDQERHTSGIGLHNVVERLDLLYGSDAQVDIKNLVHGVCVTVTMPLGYEPPLQLDTL